MKKLILLFCSFMLLAATAFAGDSAIDNSNWGIPSNSQNTQQTGQEAENVWETEQNQTMYDNYGSADSPGFLNSINPPQNEYEYDSDCDFDDTTYSDD